jgi:hypothetical protein
MVNVWSGRAMRWMRRSSKPLCTLLLALTVTAGCAASGRESSGVSGTTSINGACPVTPGETSCPDHPFRAHLTLVRIDSGAIAGEADSTNNGAFRIPAPPGAYLLKAVNLTGAPLPAAPAVPVEVKADQFTTVLVKFDSGVR